jgi:hypothetical protein
VSYDSWKQASPTDDMPSVEDDECDVGPCSDPWCWESSEGARLCKAHALTHKALHATVYLPEEAAE